MGRVCGWGTPFGSDAVVKMIKSASRENDLRYTKCNNITAPLQSFELPSECESNFEFLMQTHIHSFMQDILSEII